MKFILLLFLFGCAKLNYLVEQGLGQLSIQSKGRENSLVLKDPTIPKSHKEKIRLVETYKKHFYQYFKRKPTSIYSKTTILKSQAVSQLVISSPKEKIEAIKECFPFVGCFPYIGFFDIESAKKYEEDQKRKDYVTFRRPVFAYSTLGYLEDRILSSFFYYDKYDLAELVFHELFHTIFFIKDQVDLNENLANYFGKEMTRDYFKSENDYLNKRSQLEKKHQQVNEFIAEKAKNLRDFLMGGKPLQELQHFYGDSFRAQISEKCQSLLLKNCPGQKGDWNNARFAAFLTYEKDTNKITALALQYGDLRQFLTYIESRYEQFNDSSEENFESYLLGK